MKAKEYFNKVENMPEFIFRSIYEEGCIYNSYEDGVELSEMYNKYCDKIEQYTKQRIIEELKIIMIGSEGKCVNGDVVNKIFELQEELKLKQNE